MGFLIFAYRKMYLKRKINDLEYRETILSQKHQQIAEQVGVAQQAMSAAKNMLSVFSSSKLYDIQKEVLGQYKDGKVPETDYAKVQVEMQNKQNAVTMTNSVANSIFEAASTAQMAPLNAIGNQIEQEIASIESQLKTLRPELESVEKGETEAAKQATPKFGLG